MSLHARLKAVEEELNPASRKRGPFDGFAARMRALGGRPRQPTNPAPGTLAGRMQRRGAPSDGSDLT